MKKDYTLQNTIYLQIGGARFRALTAARIYYLDEKDRKGLRIIFRKKQKSIKTIDIVYQPGPDLYDMHFYGDISVGELTTKARDRVFAEDLVEIINQECELDLPLIEFGSF